MAAGARIDAKEQLGRSCQNDRMNIDSPHLVLRALTRIEAEQIVTEDRAGQSWAPDYPTPADVGITAIALAGRAVFPSDEVPWGSS